MLPMLPTLVKEPFDDTQWIFEVKWDGYRALACKSKKISLLSRNEKSFNDRFPSIVEELKKIPGAFILDGEIVVLDKNHRSRFQLLQKSEEHLGTLQYYLFDILSYQGKDLRELPLIERKEILRKLLGRRRWKYLSYSEHIETFGKGLFTQAKKHNLEGIIAKKKDSTYQCARSRDWLKIKTKLRQEFVIGGFSEPREGRHYFSSLLIGVYDKGRLLYVGRVGGGFSQQLLKDVYKQLMRLVRKKCPFAVVPKLSSAVTWVQPTLVCEVAFGEWTHDGMLRQPIFQGLRMDKSPKMIVREKPDVVTH